MHYLTRPLRRGGGTSCAQRAHETSLSLIDKHNRHEAHLLMSEMTYAPGAYKIFSIDESTSFKVVHTSYAPPLEEGRCLVFDFLGGMKRKMKER